MPGVLSMRIARICINLIFDDSSVFGQYAAAARRHEKDSLMLQKYRHVIWDWNGTLLDDAWLCVEILNEILCARGKRPITHRRYMEEFGFPVKDFYERIGFDFSDEPFEALARDYIGKYDARCRECTLHDRALDVVRRCKECGIEQSVLSAYHRQRLEGMLDFFDLRPLFARVVGLDDYHAHGKIEQGVRLVAESGFDSGQAVLIGDTIHDHEVAQEAGADCILFAGGHYLEQRLRSCGVPVVSSLGQLLKM